MNWNVFLLCLLLSFSAAAQETIPFQFTANHTAMLVRVKVPGFHGKHYMQFDLGSPHTLLYKNKLPGVTDTLHNHSLLIHKTRFTPQHIPVIDAGHSGPIIGTLGADFINNKVVIFDYPRRRLIISDSIPKKYQTTLYPFHFMAGRVLLPAKIANQSTILYFDTGSSAYSLITDSATAISLAIPGAAPDNTPVKSWGRTLTAHNLPSADSVIIAGRSLPLHKVTWMSGASDAQVQQMKRVGIGGMTGNRLFLGRVLVVDVRNRRFGIR